MKNQGGGVKSHRFAQNTSFNVKKPLNIFVRKAVYVREPVFSM